MDNLKMAPNVQIATIAGFLSAIIEHVCKANGVEIPDDISAGLPAIVALLVAHIVDIYQGTNK